MTEVWHPIPGYEGLYEVSSHGRVRSFHRVTNLPCPHLSKLHIDAHGYTYVNFSKDGHKHKRKVHQLVLEAFHGPKPPGCVVHHKNSVRTNNYLSNLEYASYKDNTLH